MKTSSDPRHIERQKIVQELFAWDAHQKSAQKTPSELSAKSETIVANISDIDQLVKASAPEWEIDRINQIDLAILRLGIFELAIEPTAPAKVIIDEMVELAKEFGSETSPSFINGALGTCLLMPDRVKKVLELKLGADPKDLTPEANLATDLNATALEISDLLTILEKDYSISFDKTTKPKTVGDLLAQIEDQVE